MSFVKRAWLNVSRKLAKSLTIFLVLLTACTLLLSTFAVREAVARTSDEVGSELLAGFSVQNNQRTNPGTARGAGNVSRAQIEAIAKLPGITKYVANMSSVADIENAEICKLDGAASDYSQEREEKFGNAVMVNAVNKSDLATPFRAGTFTLAQGRHLTDNDHHKVMVHEEFAAKNNLKVGDTLRMRGNIYDPDNRFQSDAAVDAEIVGTFSGKNARPAAQRLELYQNAIFTDLDTARTLNGTTPENEIYQDAGFFVNSVKDVDSVMKAAAALPLDWDHYELVKNTDMLGALAYSLQSINSLVNATFIGTLIFTIVALALVLALWMNERRKETGILLAVGVSKAKIFAQYLTENIFAFVVAVVASFGTATLLAQKLGDGIVSRASAQTSAQLNGGQNFGTDFYTSTIQKTVDHVNVVIEPSHLVMVGVAGLILVIVATLIASAPMLSKRPKQLLTQIG